MPLPTSFHFREGRELSQTFSALRARQYRARRAVQFYEFCSLAAARRANNLLLHKLAIFILTFK